jgi:hypothetical protein
VSAAGWNAVDRAPEATTVDDWLSGLAALAKTLGFIHWTITWSIGSMPTAVQAILSQFEEPCADVPVAMMNMELGERRGGGLPGFHAYERDLQKKYEEQGDTLGQRFRRERLLLPSGLPSSATATHGENAPSRRIAVPWTLCHILSIDAPGLVQPHGPAEPSASQKSAEQTDPRRSSALTRSCAEDGRQRPGRTSPTNSSNTRGTPVCTEARAT